METLSVVIPFFALVLIGYLAARSRLLPVDSVAGLNVFVLYFALPALLFQFGSTIPISQILHPVILGLWLVSGLLVLALGIFTGLRAGRGWLDAAFGGLIANQPNSGFMGLPLIVSLLGPWASGPVMASLLVDMIIIQAVALALSQQDQAGSWAQRFRPTVMRMVTNPLPWAIGLGAAYGLSGYHLPTPAMDIVTLLAGAATPAALFTIGAVLAREGMRVRAAQQDGGGQHGTGWGSADAWWLAGVKLVVHPVLVWTLSTAAITLGLPVAESDRVVLTLTAALPSAANIAMLAERRGAENGRIAAVILISTLVGLFTFTALAILL